MSASAKVMPAQVSPEEVARRIAEYRRIGFQRQAPAHVVYHEEHHACPWAGCDMGIAGINFQLDAFGDTSRQAELMAAWWNGPGLVRAAPGVDAMCCSLCIRNGPSSTRHPGARRYFRTTGTRKRTW